MVTLKTQVGASMDARNAVVDRLYDLQHDLAKYLRMPLTFLPSHSTAYDLRDAVHRALRETYRRGDRLVRADELWAECAEWLPVSVKKLESFRRLDAAVTRAVAWERSIDNPAITLERSVVLADFSAVGAAIDLLIMDVESEEALL
ncbi:MAG: hypothetical protein AAFU77_12135 [Myxococcota bacterium]